MKKSIFKSIILFFLFITVEIAFCNNITIQGSVSDSETGASLADVNVTIKYSLKGTSTDIDGKFKLNIENVSDSKITLVFSHLGYRTLEKEIDFARSTKLSISLVPDIINLNEVIVKTKKISTSANEQTITSQVVSKDFINEVSPLNIAEVLLKVPGVNLAGQSYHAAPSIRGLARKRVVVMADGEKISSERNVGAPGTFINPFEIDRIEILKGPYSTLFGSDAIGGIVNIITKKYEQPYYFNKIGGLLNLSYQSVSNGKNVNLSLNGITDNIIYRISAGWRDADSYSTPNHGKLMNTFYNEKHIGAKLFYNINNNHQISVKSYYSTGNDIGKPAYDIYTNAIHDRDNHLIYGINYNWNKITSILKKVRVNITSHYHDLGARIKKHKLELNSNDDKLIKNQKNLEGNDYITQLDFYFELNNKTNLLAGFDGYFREGINIDESKVVKYYYSGLFVKSEDLVLVKNGYQNTYGIFAQINYQLSPKLFTNCGVRWNYVNTGLDNKNENFKDQSFSGNVGISYLFSDKFSAKANIGSAFRVPDIKELYVTTNTPGGLNIGNSNLNSEHSFNLDLSFIYKNSTTFSELSLFRNAINNMVILDWDAATGGREGKFKNIGKGLLYGGEFQYSQKITTNLSSNINITKIWGFDQYADDELMDVPPLQINANIKYKFRKIWFNLSGRYSAEQKDVAEDDITTDSFFLFNIGCGWKIIKNLNLIITAVNVLDKEYREHYQFAWMSAPARSFNLTMNINL